MPVETIRAITADVAGAVPVSATVGDHPPGAVEVRTRMLQLARLPVDIIKVGLFGPLAGLRPALAALPGILGRGQSLYAVVLAESGDWPSRLAAAADAGVAGVMLDTADKQAGPLTAQLPMDALAGFVEQARERGLHAGLAGSLRIEDIPRLLPLGADFLGFRSALCAGTRGGQLDPARLAAVRLAMPPTSADGRRLAAPAGSAA